MCGCFDSLSFLFALLIFKQSFGAEELQPDNQALHAVYYGDKRFKSMGYLLVKYPV